MNEVVGEKIVPKLKEDLEKQLTIRIIDAKPRIEALSNKQQQKFKLVYRNSNTSTQQGKFLAITDTIMDDHCINCRRN